MKSRAYMLPIVLVALLTLSVAAYADDRVDISLEGPILIGGGGAGHGGMGDHGGMGGRGMMGWGRELSALWEYLSKRFAEQDQDAYDQKDTEELRKEIKDKREELASMLGSSNNDEKVINKKIDELNRLELELDRTLRAREEEK
jgi:Spy/CpxP family protein refolding chaperone